MATATIYLYENSTQNYSIPCWADREFSRGPATVKKTANVASPSYPFTMVSAGSITAGNLVSMPNSNVQNLVFSYNNLSKYKINIAAITLHVTLASDVTFDGITVGNSFYSYPVYNTEYSGAIDLTGVNTTEKTITATLSIDPYLSSDVLTTLGGGYSWDVVKEATVTEDVFQSQDTVGSFVFERYYQALSGIQRSWCSAKVTNIYLVVDYTEDTSVVVDRLTATSMLSVGVSGAAKKVNDMFVGVNGVAKKISEAWIGINGVAKKIYPAYLVGMLNPGDIIQIDEEGTGTNYVEWMVMHHDYYETGQTILMRKYCLPDNICLNYSENLGQYNYPYFDYDADDYLTDTWLSARSTEFQNLLIETTIAGRTWSGGTIKTATRKVWLPAAVNLSASNFEEGSTAYYDDTNGAFDYFATNDTLAARIAYVAEDGDAVRWWTRTVIGGTYPYQRTINALGDFSSYYYYDFAYLRPVINVYSNNCLEKISDGVYRMIGGGHDAGLITFTVDGISYQAEKGSTWGEWIESKYNTDGFYLIGNYVYKNSSYYVGYSSTTSHNCTDSEAIEAGHAYALWEEAGSAPE